MRGKGYDIGILKAGKRITPAYAGKRHTHTHTHTGSPPRMRRKAKNLDQTVTRDRITPAYAGKRQRWHGKERSRRDHPRVCGEKAYINAAMDGGVGSPPRMRGKVLGCCFAAGAVGITPAYAGKSPALCGPPAPSQDHPRVCGEKANAKRERRGASGSPPRMRGKECLHHNSHYRDRITPAYAGKRQMALAVLDHSRDHPRVCGEKRRLAGCAPFAEGSPPRMRGKVFRSSQCDGRAGITPAYAGKRLKRSHRIGHFSCILCLFHSVLHRASASGGSRAGPCAPPCLPAQNAVPV